MNRDKHRPSVSPRGASYAAIVVMFAASSMTPSAMAAQCGHPATHHEQGAHHDPRTVAPAPQPASSHPAPATETGCCSEASVAPSAWDLVPEAAAPSPYAGLEARPIKALSAERRDGLLAGAGLGYAMAAELNGHAGPKHVLELAAALALTPEQRAGVQASFDRMHAESVRLGTALVAAEEQLDRRFAHRHLDAARLAELTAAIARLEGELRYAHLVAHLETDALLTAEQRARYVELRGYGDGGAAPGGSEHVH